MASLGLFLNTAARRTEQFCGWCQAQRAARLLRASAARTSSLQSLIELAFQFDHAGIKIAPMQIRAEIAALLEFLQLRRARRIMEIGTARGGTCFLLSRVAAEDAQIITLDLPDGLFGDDSYPWRTQLVRSIGCGRQKIHALQADSQQAQTFEQVKKLLGDEPLDFLFIDGDHRYEGVKNDAELYMPLVRDGGVIAWHDIVPGEPQYVGGVPDFWREMKAGRQAREFVESWAQGGYGIGLIEKES